jgi:hypothetical protein
MKHLIPVLLVISATLTACAAPRPTAHDYCQSGHILLDAHFDGGQLGKCTASGNGVFELTLFPEDAPPINKSPWFAYRVSGRKGDDVLIRMQFEDGYARYWPKISLDGKHWTPLAQERVARAEDGASMEVSVELDQARVWIAGQEILNQEFYGHWINRLEADPAIDTEWLGKSVEGRPIFSSIRSWANRNWRGNSATASSWVSCR